MSEIKCPKCESNRTEEYDLEYEYDEKLGKYLLHRSLVCGDCKCEFTVTYVRDKNMTEINGTAEPFREERTK